MESELDGENNKVRNQQKIDILLPNLAINEGDSCDVWSSYGFEGFEYIILTFLMISLMYWGLKKMFSKDRWIKSNRKSKEKAKARKFQTMKETLQKQGIMITEAKESNLKEEVTESKEELYYHSKFG